MKLNFPTSPIVPLNRHPAIVVAYVIVLFFFLSSSQALWIININICYILYILLLY